MKRLILFLTAITVFCISMSGQNYANYEKFRNEKLGIFHTVEDGRDRMPGDHFLTFDNYTNNNMRVTYKVKVRVIVVRNSSYKDFTYTNTLYIKPKSWELDHFWDNQTVMNYIQNVSGNQWYGDACRLLFTDFELINYGVEQKNYETTY